MKAISTFTLISMVLFFMSFGCKGIAGGTPGQEVRRFESPDGHYAVVVRFDSKSEGPITPGSSGDRPGFVQLVNSQGKILKQASVDMVGRVDQVIWSENQVEVKMVAIWQLKPEKR